MADFKLAYGTVTDITGNLNTFSLGTSNTTGWQSAVQNNSSDKFIDAHVMITINHSTGASPTGNKATFVYAWGGIESGVYSSYCGASAGALTFPDVTTLQNHYVRIGTIHYNTLGEQVNGGPFSVANNERFGGKLSMYWGICLINQSGTTFDGSGAAVKFQGLYFTVV